MEYVVRIHNRRYTRNWPNWPSERFPFVGLSTPEPVSFSWGAREIARNRLNRKEGGRGSGGGILRPRATIYDGLAGTYLGQRLLSVIRERK